MRRLPTCQPACAALLALLLAGGGVAAKDRHDHRPVSRLFISPMGEPFRSDLDGDPEAAWFAGADADHDGRISLAEFQADAQRWFLAADRGHDGEIDPDDIDYYENQLIPELRVADAPRGRDTAPAAGSGTRHGGRGGGGRMGSGGMGSGGMGSGGMGGSGGGGGMGSGGMGRGGRGSGSAGQDAGRAQVVRATRQGAARFSYLDFPEPLTAADANLNRGIDKDEMARAAAERFATLDKNGDGLLDRRELPRVDTRTTGPGPHAPRPGRPRAPDAGRQLGGGDRDQD